jgi:hypothetical protein
LDDAPLLRRFSATRKPSEVRLFRFLISYVLSYMALHNLTDFDQAVVQMAQAARAQQEAHCSRNLGIEFAEWVCVQAAIKAKRFNLPFDSVAVHEEVDSSVDEELGTIAYYKASRGE